MPTIFTHAIVPASIALAAGPERIPHRLAIAGIVLSMLPDADVMAFRLGIPYVSPFGHRGISHSLLAAALTALLVSLAFRHVRIGWARAYAFLFVAMASHGLLDAFTTGGEGVALLWPFSDARFFAPWRMIRVSPIGVAPIFSARGITVLVSELTWVWVPALAAAWLVRHRLRLRDEARTL